MLLVVFVVGPPLIALGMIGLGLRYGYGVGRLGKAFLFIGAVSGMVALPLAFLAEAILSGNSDDGAEFIGTFVIFVVAMFLGLALFGILSLRWKAMPRWNGLPIIAGLWFPAAILIGTNTTDGFWNDSLIPAVLIFACATTLLGYSLQADQAGERIVAQ